MITRAADRFQKNAHGASISDFRSGFYQNGVTWAFAPSRWNNLSVFVQHDWKWDSQNEKEASWFSAGLFFQVKKEKVLMACGKRKIADDNLVFQSCQVLWNKSLISPFECNRGNDFSSDLMKTNLRPGLFTLSQIWMLPFSSGMFLGGLQIVSGCYTLGNCSAKELNL